MAKKKSKAKASKSSSVPKSTAGPEGQPQPPEDTAKISAEPSPLNQIVIMKVCRLCEGKDGPFLNIFDAETITAKKIEDLMPFVVAENDDLPHKICFRCSAKVEELYEFIQKCIKTQENLRNAAGKKGSLVYKTKTRTIWEEKLNKTNMSNDELCDALIKKAMESIKDIPLNPQPLDDEVPLSSLSKKESIYAVGNTVSPSIVTSKKEVKSQDSNTKKDEEDNVNLKQTKIENEKSEKRILPARASRSNNFEPLLDGLEVFKPKKPAPKKSQNDTEEKLTSNVDVKNNVSKDAEKIYKNMQVTQPVKKIEDEIKPKEVIQIPKEVKPFDIMDHVTMIKVNGVGVLFQCKLCNRNFLKKEVVMSHGCAKNGTPKTEFPKNITPLDPPKVPNTIKYINTKIDGEIKRPQKTETKHINEVEKQNSLILGSKKVENNSAKTDIEVVPLKKPKPRIGPASKIRPEARNIEPTVGMLVTPKETHPQNVPNAPNLTTVTTPSSTPNSVLPCVNFPQMPSLNSRYKLVPGPNNTYTLVEDQSAVQNQEPLKELVNTKSTKKRKKTSETTESQPPNNLQNNNTVAEVNNTKGGTSTIKPFVIDLEDTPTPPVHASQPYPVGLFQTVAHHSNNFPPALVPSPAVFATPASKKQSYTVVQTGNPSKLLISTKPQPIPEEVPKKKQKKSKHETPKECNTEKQPFSVTLEDTSPPKDSGFFTFINVDPLLQPSYVLPTANIIQESQISTSTPIVKGAQVANNSNKDTDNSKYSCNLCGKHFTREKKLLTHINSHYNKLF